MLYSVQKRLSAFFSPSLYFCAYVVFGFMKGFQPVAGYNYGAKKYSCLNEGIKVSLLLAMG
jgi:Na+-driven multidrug efflux pump